MAPGLHEGWYSCEKYQFYSRARTFAKFDALTKGTFVSGSTGGNRLKATPKGLLFDAARGTVTFVDAADSDDDLSNAEEGVESTSSGGESETGGEQPEPAAPMQAV